MLPVLALGRRLLGKRGNEQVAKAEIDGKAFKKDFSDYLDKYRQGIVALSEQESFTFNGINVTTREELDKAFAEVIKANVESSLRIVSPKVTSRRGAIKALVGLTVAGAVGVKATTEAIDSAKDAGMKTLEHRIDDTVQQTEDAAKSLEKWKTEAILLSGDVSNEFQQFMATLAKVLWERKGEAASALLNGIADDIGDYINRKDASPDKLRIKIREFIDLDPALKKEYEDLENAIENFKAKLGELDSLGKKFKDIADIRKQGDAFEKEFKHRFVESLKYKASFGVWGEGGEEADKTE